MNSIPQIVCTAGPMQGHRANVTEAGVRIGRDPSCEIHLQDPDVSRSHARIILHNSAVWVQDAGSRNGVFVNDKRVVDNKSIGPGDRVHIGPHHFVLELLDVQEDDPSVSVRLDSLEEPEKRFKIWPFALVLVILGGGIGVISMGGGGGPALQDQVDPGEYSLTAALKPQEDGAGGADPLSQALASSAKDPREDWPDPPEGATLTELVEQGHAHYQAGRLRDALAQYQMALKLDESCEICVARIPRIEGEIAAQVKENFDAGLRYYNSLKYREAINAWETVLLLEPDETSPVHKQTQEYLAQAREKQAGQF